MPALRCPPPPRHCPPPPLPKKFPKSNAHIHILDLCVFALDGVKNERTDKAFLGVGYTIGCLSKVIIVKLSVFIIFMSIWSIL